MMRFAILAVVSGKNSATSPANPTARSGNPLRQTQLHQRTVFRCLTAALLYATTRIDLHPGPFRVELKV